MIDKDASWGFSHTKGWIFGYKLHITASTGSLIVPLSTDFTHAANKIISSIVCPVSEIYMHTSGDRLQLIGFYESELGQVIYSWRSISVEPLIEYIKGIFKIDPLQVRGY